MSGAAMGEGEKGGGGDTPAAAQASRMGLDAAPEAAAARPGGVGRGAGRDGCVESGRGGEEVR